MTVALIPPSGPQSESITVAGAAATLAYAPDPDSVIIAGYTKIFTGTPGALQYKVTPGSAVLAFNAANNGANLTCKYATAAAVGVSETKVNEIITAVNALEGEDPESLLTTKGDIIARNATDPVRLAVGANGTVLTADSTEATGIKWAAPAAGYTPGRELFTASGDFNVPAGITLLKIRLWGGGGGGGGGSGDTGAGIVNGVAGADGGNVSLTGVDFGNIVARGGKGGSGGSAADGDDGAGYSDPSVAGAAIVQKSGVLPNTVSNRTPFGINHIGGAHGTTGGAPTAGESGSAIAANSGLPGGGGGGNTAVEAAKRGGRGAPGEYMEALLTVTPLDVIPVVIGAAGAGGAGGGETNIGANGGDGAQGMVLIEW